MCTLCAKRKGWVEVLSRVDAPASDRCAEKTGLNARFWSCRRDEKGVECVMHGCCSLVRAPTELERTQDMHTATCRRAPPKRASTDRASVSSRLDTPARGPTCRYSQPYAHRESAHEVTQPVAYNEERETTQSIQRGTPPVNWRGKWRGDQTGPFSFHLGLLVNIRLRRLLYIRPGFRSCLSACVALRQSRSAPR